MKINTMTPHFEVSLDNTGTTIPFELEGLIRAKNYQRWVYDRCRPYLGNSILEFGSGLGNLSRWLPVHEKLILSEYDPALISVLQKNAAQLIAERPQVKIVPFDLEKGDPSVFYSENVDTIVSFNVLEHVSDDLRALKNQISILKNSKVRGTKHLICFVPAHPFAFGNIDRTFDHHRRYSRQMMLELVRRADPLIKPQIQFMNLPGLLGWWLQGRVLGKSHIGLRSIQTFELLCPFIRPLDDFIHKSFRLPFGQSLQLVLRWDEV